MMALDYKEFKIIGFDERVQLACARSRPIVQHKQTDRFFGFTIGTNIQDKVENPFTRAEMETWVKEGRISLLPQSVPLFPSARVLYITDEALAMAESTPPESFGGANLSWQALPNQGARAWVTCASNELVESLMNHWGRLLMEKATKLLVEYFSTQDSKLPEVAEEVAEMAKSAALEAALRYRIYSRLAVAVMFSGTPERLENVYRLIRLRVPNLEREAFFADLNGFVDILQRRAYAEKNAFLLSLKGQPPLEKPQPDISASSTKVPEPSVIKQEEIQEEILDKVTAINRISDPQERLEQSKGLAAKYRSRFPIDDRLLDQIKEALPQYPGVWLYLSYEILSGLASEPAFYYKGVVAKFGQRPALNVIQFVNAVHEYKEEGIPPGKVAEVLTEKIQQDTQEEILDKVDAISQIPDPQEHLEQSKDTAAEYSTRFPLNERLLEQIKKAAAGNIPWLSLNYEFIVGLAGEPAFYGRGVVFKLDKGPALSLIQFGKAIKEYAQAGAPPGRAARTYKVATGGGDE